MEIMREIVVITVSLNIFYVFCSGIRRNPDHSYSENSAPLKNIVLLNSSNPTGICFSNG